MTALKLFIGLLIVTSIGLAGLAKAEKAELTAPTESQDKVPAKRLFGAASKPAALTPQAYGFYSRGCLAGGVELPPDGTAWQAMRLKRNRNWGHPVLVELVKKLAVESQAYDGWSGLMVGDLAQPRGGPMLTGHASHQLGLDADIWLNPMPQKRLTYEERQTISAVSVIKSRKEINPKVWSDAHARLIKRAAGYDKVARIFVHPPIKKALCDWSKGQADRRWLMKVRPYYGHHYHFHIRIKCPPGSPQCKNQPAPYHADGTGCGKHLAYWFSEKPWAKPKKVKKKPVDKSKTVKPRKKPKRRKPVTLANLPRACKSVINASSPE